MNLFNYDKEVSGQQWDVIIVGSGLSGLYTALNLHPSKKVLLVTKKRLENSNSYLAQGGIAAVLTKEDSFESHYEDTMTTGHCVNSHEAVRYLVEEGPKEVERLIRWGVKFDRDDLGQLSLAKEGAHSFRRIARCGDYTGRAVMDHLIGMAKKAGNIKVLEHVHITDLLSEGKTVIGVGGVSRNGVCSYFGKSVVIATGGLGQLFPHTTNDETITGDGFQMAQKLGISLEHMDRIQFHPTALFEEKTAGKRFLVSEALRGEGAELRDDKDALIMEGVHPLGSLAPRDIVTHAIHQVMASGQLKHVYLDGTHLSEATYEERFPTIRNYCLSIGINPSRDYIPVVPCCHYMMGGIPVSLRGRTAISNLYACGEVASTNVHGNNRLASNSLLECLVFGRSVAQAINEEEVNHDNK